MQLACTYYKSFDELPSGYESVFAERPELTFDQSLPWLRRLAGLLSAQGGHLTIIGVESDGVPALALPLLKVPPPGLKPDADLRSVANFYTAFYGPVAVPSLPMSVELLETLTSAMAGVPGGWQVLDLSPVDPAGGFAVGVTAQLKRRGVTVEPYFRFGNWYLETGGRTFEQYYGERPSQLRETVRRRRRKLEKEKNADFQIVTQPGDVDAAMDEYETIYAKSWKQPEPHLDFLRGVAKDFAAAGWLRLGMLRVEGRPAAAQMWFVFGKTASIFKLAYDPDFQAYSVGSLLTTHLMEHVFSVDRVAVVDYLCGDDSYKKDWMPSRRERWGLRAYRLTSLRGIVGATHSAAGRIVRRIRARRAK